MFWDLLQNNVEAKGRGREGAEIRWDWSLKLGNRYRGLNITLFTSICLKLNMVLSNVNESKIQNKERKGRPSCLSLTQETISRLPGGLMAAGNTKQRP